MGKQRSIKLWKSSVLQGLVLRQSLCGVWTQRLCLARRKTRRILGCMYLAVAFDRECT
jgi:hypothetical protein